MTSRPREVRFGPFRLDVQDERLWQGPEAIRLRPKTFAVLRYLVERPGRLVTREELLEGVWPGQAVGEDVLTACLRDLRRALDDDPRQPRYVETVHRRGYRFIAPLLSGSPVASGPPAASRPTGLVGREAELARLRGWLAEASGGRRRVVFVTGEGGIGKTALVDAFLEDAAAAGTAWIGRGECLEHFGAGEPYLPLLAALGRLGRGAEGAALVPLLRTHAPTWLREMPALVSEAELEAVQRRAAGAAPGRMLRELAEALEAITAERPLVLVLEDLHWSDHATLDLLAYLARRPEPARLLLVATYRPVEVIVRGHPLAAVSQELTGRGFAEELPLELLTEADVARYLASRAPAAIEGPEAERLARTLHQRTDGHPLFMVTVVEALARRQVLGSEGWNVPGAVEAVTREVPESLRQLIEQQLDGLDADDRGLLEAASASGPEWSAPIAAAALEAEVPAVEERSERLARHGFLAARGTEEWPDGTLAARYAFLHALHQQVCYERLAPARRAQIHARIGARAEAGYGERAGEHATELAEHFERGRDSARALRYRRQAAAGALGRWAYHEGVDHLTRGLDVLKRLPDTPDRVEQELDLLVTLGPALIAVHGQAAQVVADAYGRARELCRRLGDTRKLFPVLHGLRRFYTGQNDHETALELGEEMLRLAQGADDRALLLEAHFAVGIARVQLGEQTLAYEHFSRGSALDAGRPDVAHIARYGLDTALVCMAHAAQALCMLGFPERAQEWSERAIARMRDHPHALSRVMCLTLLAALEQWLGRAPLVQEHAEAALALAREHGFPFWTASTTVLRGWAVAAQGRDAEGIALMREGLTAYHATGSQIIMSYFASLLGERLLRAGLAGEGLTLITEMQEAALHRGYLYRGELERLRGELLLRSSADAPARGRSRRRLTHAGEAEACFRQALDIARPRGLKALELRAGMSLARLWQRQGKPREARALLGEIYGRFTEGLETADLREARALLDDLAAR